MRPHALIKRIRRTLLRISLKYSSAGCKKNQKKTLPTMH
jgi:hypothetical protein